MPRSSPPLAGGQWVRNPGGSPPTWAQTLRKPQMTAYSCGPRAPAPLVIWGTSNVYHPSEGAGVSQLQEDRIHAPYCSQSRVPLMILYSAPNCGKRADEGCHTEPFPPCDTWSANTTCSKRKTQPPEGRGQDSAIHSFSLDFSILPSLHPSTHWKQGMVLGRRGAQMN